MLECLHYQVQIMEMKNTIYVTNRNDWRNWLEKNHNSENEIWLIYYKKHTGKARIPYNDAVEEAICFGWIDSIIQKIDDEKYAQKFTPRTNTLKWSEMNIKRAKKMIKEGKMTEAGLGTVGKSVLTEKRSDELIKKKELELPETLLTILKKNKIAWKNFNNLAPSHKRQYIGWILDAKKIQTQLRRLNEAIANLEENKKLGLK